MNPTKTFNQISQHKPEATEQRSISMSKPLHKRYDFIAAIALPIIISLVTGLTIGLSEPSMKICFTSTCYSNFVSIFKIPITLSALSFPLAGIVAAYHRSIETSKQIAIAESNNTFSNYMKHRDDFISHIEHLEEIEEHLGRINDLRVLYSIIYPQNSYTHFDPSAQISDEHWLLKDIDNISRRIAEAQKRNFPREEIFQILKLAYEYSAKITHHPKAGNGINVNYRNSLAIPIVYSPNSPMQHILELEAIRRRIRIMFNLEPRLPVPTWVHRDTETAFRLFVDHERIGGPF